MSNRGTVASGIGVDQGSSSTKAVVVSAEGRVVDEHAWPVRTVASSEGPIEMVEHEPEEVVASVRAAISWGIAVSRDAGCRAEGIGLAVQRSGVVAWNPQGRAVSRVLSWRDGRTHAVCEHILADNDTVALIAQRSGLMPNRFFAASKWALMQERFLDQSVRVGTLDSFLVSQLVGHERFVTDDSMAARTLLYDLEARGWSSELCAVWGVDHKRLPQILPSLSHRGVVSEGLPVLASLGDKEAAAVYLLARSDGEASLPERAVLDLGTLATLTVASESVPRAVPGIGRGVLCSFEGETGERRIRYEQEIRTSIVGDVLDWLAVRVGRRLSFDELAQFWAVASEHDGVMYCAARTGSFGDAAGESGEMRGDRVGDAEECLVRAALEHVVFSLTEEVTAARSAGMLGARAELVVSGGLANVAGVCQFLADCAQSSLMVRDSGASASALGAASLVLDSAVGRLDGVERPWFRAGGERRYEPAAEGISGRVSERYRRWCMLRDSSGVRR